ncbi:MAG: PAS domain S-box protein [Candidatus Bathyarchaeota archaeon]|nr:PAS domain S-box protein [Candidatus Bathyarchaeota archaeon]
MKAVFTKLKEPSLEDIDEVQIRNLINIIQFIERVSTKLHGQENETALFDMIADEFRALEGYTIAILKLSDDGTKIKVAKISTPTKRLKSVEKIIRTKIMESVSDLDSMGIIHEVVKKKKTVCIPLIDVLNNILSKRLSIPVAKVLGYIDRSIILTPIYMKKKVCGIIGIVAPYLSDYFVPTVRNLASHISTALEMIEDKSKANITEEELRKSEAKYRSLIEDAGSGVAVTDMRGRFTYINKALCKMIGYSEEEMIGKNFYEFLHPDDKKELVKKFLGAWRHPRRKYDLEYRVMHKDGHPVHMHSSPTLYILNRRIVGFQVIANDISDRKKIEEELKKSEEIYRNTSTFLDNILSNMSDWLFVIDEDYTLQFINETARNIHGDIIGEKCYKAVRNLKRPCHYKGVPCEVQQILENGKDYFEDTRMADEVGKISHVRAKPTKTSDGKKAVISVVRDVTDEKKTEEALRRVEQEKTRTKMKDHFIIIASHELRTPLISIKGYVDYILAGKLGPISARMKSSLDAVRRNTNRLINLTEDLLDIRRIESGKIQLNMKPMDLRDVLNHCLIEIKPFIAGKNQVFDTKIPNKKLKVRGDYHRLSQVLMNLLHNATKFTLKKGKISLNVKEKKRYFQIEVSDTGMGIKKGDIEKIFQPFADIKKETFVKGTGLGLSVSKGLIEGHYGKIWAESPGERKGSTFIFTIPRFVRSR